MIFDVDEMGVVLAFRAFHLEAYDDCMKFQ